MPEAELVCTDKIRIVQAVVTFHIGVKPRVDDLPEFRVPDVLPDAIDLINRVGLISRKFGFVRWDEIAVRRLKQAFEDIN